MISYECGTSIADKYERGALIVNLIEKEKACVTIIIKKWGESRSTIIESLSGAAARTGFLRKKEKEIHGKWGKW